MSIQVYRQGDVLFYPIERTEVPDAATPQGSRLIRRGEHGGLHQLESQAQEAEHNRSTIVVHNGTKYVLSPTGVGIVHGEHARLPLPPGAYRVVVQREQLGSAQRYVVD